MIILGSATSSHSQGFCPAGTPYNNIIAGTAYTIGQTDYCLVDTFTSSSSVAIKLPAPGTAGGFQLGFIVTVYMSSTGTGTITPQANAAGTTPTINGRTSLILAGAHAVTITVGTDGNYYAQGGSVAASRDLNLRFATADTVILSLAD
jgi:hypothetical protein